MGSLWRALETCLYDGANVVPEVSGVAADGCYFFGRHGIQPKRDTYTHSEIVGQ